MLLNKEAVKALGEDLLWDRVGQSLGEFLVNSSVFVSQVEANMMEELALQTHIFAKREVALIASVNRRKRPRSLSLISLRRPFSWRQRSYLFATK